MPASLRSDYPIKNLMAGRPFCPDQGVTFTGIRREYTKPRNTQGSFLETVAFRYHSKSRNFSDYG